MMYDPVAIIDKNALQHNVKRVKQSAPQTHIIAMVKADAYGHGLQEVAAHLSDVDAFGVARLNEALCLQGILPHIPRIIMDGLITAEEFVLAAQHGFQVVIHDVYHWQVLQQLQLPQPLAVWLKIDTGMHRLGVLPAEVVSLWQALQTATNVVKPIGLMTHFARADELDCDFTTQQQAIFSQSIALLSGPISLANSAAILSWPVTHGDWVRPGIMLYGVSPFADKTAAHYELQPVMTLQASLIAVRTLEAGAAIGYGSRWICPEAMTVGVVGIGYGDGYPRHIVEGTPVLLQGQRAAILGRVSMDMLTIDLRQHPTAKVGDTVTLWGRGLPVEEIAQCAGTIAYELLCQVTSRVKRVTSL